MLNEFESVFPCENCIVYVSVAILHHAGDDSSPMHSRKLRIGERKLCNRFQESSLLLARTYVTAELPNMINSKCGRDLHLHICVPASCSRCTASAWRFTGAKISSGHRDEVLGSKSSDIKPAFPKPCNTATSSRYRVLSLAFGYVSYGFHMEEFNQSMEACMLNRMQRKVVNEAIESSGIVDANSPVFTKSRIKSCVAA